MSKEKLQPLDELLESKSLESIKLDREQAIAFRDRAEERGAERERAKNADLLLALREVTDILEGALATDVVQYHAPEWVARARAAIERQGSPAAANAGGFDACVFFDKRDTPEKVYSIGMAGGECFDAKGNVIPELGALPATEQHPAEKAAALPDDSLRARFQAQASDSYGFKRSRKGTYVNGATARDWKWFRLGAAAARPAAADSAALSEDVRGSAFPERDQTIPAEQQGIFRKFKVERVDGSDAPGHKHFGCQYYVLDLTHDQHAPAAMQAYAAACRATHPQLADDIEGEYGRAPAVMAGGLSPLDYRAQGREEALAVILALDAETQLDDFVSSVAMGDSGDYNTHWDEDKLRVLLHIGDRTHDAYDRAEAAYWEAMGHKDEAKREMLLVEQAPFYKPLSEFLSKHQAYDLMAALKTEADRTAAMGTAGRSDIEHIKMNGHQLKQALELTWPDGDHDPDQAETVVSIARYPACRASDEDGGTVDMPAGLYLEYDDLPNEGMTHLPEEPEGDRPTASGTMGAAVQTEPFAWIVCRDATGEWDGGEPMMDKAEAEHYIADSCLPGWHLEPIYRQPASGAMGPAGQSAQPHTQFACATCGSSDGVIKCAKCGAANFVPRTVFPASDSGAMETAGLSREQIDEIAVAVMQPKHRAFFMQQVDNKLSKGGAQ